MPKHALLAEAFSFSPPLAYGPQSYGNHFYDVFGPLNDSWSYCLRAFRDGAQVTSSGTYVSATSGHANGVGIFFPSEGIVPDRYELVGAPPGNSVDVIASFDASPRGGKHRLIAEGIGGQHAFFDGFYTDTEWLAPGSDKHVAASPTIYRTSPLQTRRIYSDGSSANYTVIRWYFDAVPGGVYHLGYWMKDDVAQGTAHTTYLEAQQFPSSTQIELQGPVTITTAGWTLVEGIYTVSPSTTDTQFCMLIQSYRSGSPPPPYFETYVADWFVNRVG